MRRILPVLALALAFTGCTQYVQYWARPGGTEAQFQATSASCGENAARQFPPMTFGRPGFYPTPLTECEPTAGGTNCIVIGAGYLPQARAANDTNAWPRERAFQSCMMAAGWRPLGSPLEGTALPPSEAMVVGPHVSEAALNRALASCDATFRQRRGSPERAAFRDDFNQCVITRSRETGRP